MISFTMTGWIPAANKIARAAGQIGIGMEFAAEQTADALRRSVQSFAPVASGRFRDSWAVAKTGDAEFMVGSNAPQAWRLERGFYGADSLGRVYNQAPQPSLGPGLEATAPVFERSVMEWWKRSWS